MNFQIFLYKCNICKDWFEHYDIKPYSYGEFLLRSEGNRIERYMNGLSDSVYAEVDQLLKCLIKAKQLSDSEQTEILQSFFGAACDPASDGTPYRMFLNPQCPQCRASTIEDWKILEPPRFIEKEIPHVTHSKWNALNNEDKIQILTDMLIERGVL